ncbi:MAG: GNAT family N-acetyltransferase [Bacteroidota bacterium]
MEIEFRALVPSDLLFLKEMFFISLFAVPEEEAFPKDIIEKPHLARYHEHWGKAGDIGIIAMQGMEEIGAVWARFFEADAPGYGFVKEEAPELGIAIKKAFRGQGLGRKLMEILFEKLREKSVPAVSLSTDSRNPAMYLYQKLGFEEISREEYSVLMYKEL